MRDDEKLRSIKISLKVLIYNIIIDLKYLFKIYITNHIIILYYINIVIHHNIDHMRDTLMSCEFSLYGLYDVKMFC